MYKRIVLAYSGGLDTSVIIHWLKENYGCEVIAFSVDLGESKNVDDIRSRAIAAGADKFISKDLKEVFVKDFIFPALKAGAVYEDGYFLATALGRPLIANEMVKIAEEEGADAVAHGCSGKGNDQVRFEVSINCLSSKLKVVAPHREWNFKSREEEVDYAIKNNIPIPVDKDKIYSIDKNIWGVSIECGPHEDLEKTPAPDTYLTVLPIEKTPDVPDYIEVEFEEGIPIALNGEVMNGVQMIDEIAKIGGIHGIGRIDMIEDRLVGIKSREIYEMPAATILHRIHRELESLTLDKETRFFKEIVSRRYASLIYDGLWFTNLKNALDAFVDETQKRVSGNIRLKLYKGNLEIVRRFSKNALYDYSLATYTKEDKFDHHSAEGFIKIWGLPYRKLNL